MGWEVLCQTRGAESMWKAFGRRPEQSQSPQFLPEAEEMERLVASFRTMPSELWDKVMVFLGIDFGTVALMCGYTNRDEDSPAATAAFFLIGPAAPGGIDACRLWNGLPRSEQDSRRHILRSLTSATEAQKNKQYSFLSFPVLAAWDDAKNTDYVDRMKTMLLRFADVFSNAKAVPAEEKGRALESVRGLIDKACLPENLASDT